MRAISVRKKVFFLIVGVIAVSASVFLLSVSKNEINADSVNNESFYGMSIESVVGNENKLIITTTGAVYKLSRVGMEMYRRVDPKTNKINDRKIAQLKFDTNTGPLKVVGSEAGEVNVLSNIFSININADSYFFIDARETFTYSHKNLVTNSLYSKGEGLDRMWTDGYGGSLLARIGGSPMVAQQDEDSTTIKMTAGDTMSHMAFPPKKFDFEKLYGADARPFSRSFSSFGTWPLTSEEFQEYKDNGYGALLIWNNIYDCGVAEGPECSAPILLEDGTRGYKIREKYLGGESEVGSLKYYVKKAHDNDMDVIMYFHTPGNTHKDYWGDQLAWSEDPAVSTTFKKMQSLGEEYNFDGWYLDGGPRGSSLLESYNLAKAIRRDVGGDGIIISHESVDPWSGLNSDTGYSGLKSIMLDAYVDETLTGETGTNTIAKIEDINSDYLRFFVSGYGMSQAIGTYTGPTDGTSPLVSSFGLEQLLVQSLNGSLKNGPLLTNNAVRKSFWDTRKAEYLSSNFNPDVDWPVDVDGGWFKNLKPSSNLQIVRNSDENSAMVSWQTQEDTKGELKVADESGIWGKPPKPISHVMFSNKLASYDVADYKTASKTISFMAKPNCISTQVTPIVSFGSGNYYVGFSGDKMILSYSKDSDSNSQVVYYPNKESGKTKVIAGQWHKYTYSFDVSGDNVTLAAWIDEELVGSETFQGGYKDAFGTKLILGGYIWNQDKGAYYGAIDEVKFWDKAVGLGSSINPIAYYRFDEGGGSYLKNMINENTATKNIGALWKGGDSCYSGNCLYFSNVNSCVVNSDTMTKNHNVEIKYLEKNQNYKYRIFSTNEKMGDATRIWFGLGDLLSTIPTPSESLTPLASITPVASNTNEPVLSPTPEPTSDISLTPSPSISATPIPKIHNISVGRGYTYFNIPNDWGTVDIDKKASDTGLTIWQYNWFGDKMWQPVQRAVEVTTLRPGMGYYVSTQSDDQMIVFLESDSDDGIPMIKPGWNLLSNSSVSAIDIGTQKVRILGSGQSSGCNNSICADNTQTIKDLVGKGAIYKNIWLIRDATATDASTAFGDPVDASLSGSVIPGAKSNGSTDSQGYWIYSWGI